MGLFYYLRAHRYLALSGQRPMRMSDGGSTAGHELGEDSIMTFGRLIVRIDTPVILVVLSRVKSSGMGG